MATQFIANGIIIGCGYALIALGFGLIYNTTRIFHFAHGAVYTFAAYTFYGTYISLRWPIALAALVALVSAAIVGVLIDKVVYSPLIERGSSLFVLMLSSLGLYVVIVNVVAMIYGNENKALSVGLQPTYNIGQVILTRIQIIILVVFVAVFGLLVPFLNKTGLGKVIRAMRDDADLLSAMGKSPSSIRSIVFAMGSVISAIPAILLGLDLGIDPNVGMAALLSGAIAGIIGGIGIFEGAAIGAMVLGLLESIVVWSFSARWSQAISFVALILFLLFRPQGILGQRRRVEETAL